MTETVPAIGTGTATAHATGIAIETATETTEETIPGEAETPTTDVGPPDRAHDRRRGGETAAGMDD